MTTPDFALAYKDYDSVISSMDNPAIFRTEAYNFSPMSYQRTFPTTGNTSIKSDYGSADYDHYRPSDRSPQCIEDIIAECMMIYRKEPIVHQVIDLMSDFGSKGARVICADKRQERFIQEWSEYIDLRGFCDRFLSNLYKAGTVIVKRIDGKIPLRTEKVWKSVSRAAEEPESSDIVMESVKTSHAVIPLKWVIYDPCSIVMVGGLIANFVGKPIFGLRINTQLRNEIAQLSRLATDGNTYSDLLRMIPDYVVKAINDNATYFPLDQNKISAYYYKKDDWELWGKPIIEPILRNIKMYNKLQLADMSALDGAISSVRLWRLGNLEAGVVPSKAALDKLRTILTQNVAGGTMDFVWGPDLDFKESDSNLHQFLAPEKYTATMSAIYAGLGVPPGLTGSAGASSFTSSYVGLKTLIERLEYGRGILTTFLNEQLKIVQKAMGFKKPFRVVFDQMQLSDEAAYQKLLLDMWDRDLISDESVRYALNMDESEIEDAKISRQHRRRGKSLPDKSSPFHNPDKKFDLLKLVANQGNVTPSQLGLALPDKKPGEETHNDVQFRLKKKTEGQKTTILNKKKIASTNGRPKGSNDVDPRKKRRVLPKGAYAEVYLYAEQAKEKIDNIITSSYLAICNKKDVRSLTVAETEELEKTKFAILAAVEPNTNIDESTIASLDLSLIDNDIYNERDNLVYKFVNKYGRKPNTNEFRKIECESYANYFAISEE